MKRISGSVGVAKSVLALKLHLWYDHGLTRHYGAMHVAEVVHHYDTQSGPSESRIYPLRRSSREAGKVRHETLANLSALPPPAIDPLRAVLSGKTLLVDGGGLEPVRSLPNGHLASLSAQARALGLPDLLGPACKEREIAFALVLAQALRPVSKRATVSWCSDTTLVSDVGLDDVGTYEAYAAMGWLLTRQDAIGATLAKRHLSEMASPSRRAYFDLSSSWMRGRCWVHCRVYPTPDEHF
ncbi:hypothetical protein [Ferrimicrobium sp.]|uniref:hypothetical protein n=1 Tax=Ferrimicrobium sp. TaxID=2926050 RepID=UPI002629DB15|nr:hypothetical protein [Ferrimicrobium sp.]